ncbi:hypothetical protein R1sor_023044 [Riccia sorocarpa]|uniref:Uncharacterized protein n=1 Tax=Riccia sorocarpa TaxID=122646 RepID=A0ABD3GLK1_9MARC
MTVGPRFRGSSPVVVGPPVSGDGTIENVLNNGGGPTITGEDRETEDQRSYNPTPWCGRSPTDGDEKRGREKRGPTRGRVERSSAFMNHYQDTGEGERVVVGLKWEWRLSDGMGSGCNYRGCLLFREAELSETSRSDSLSCLAPCPLFSSGEAKESRRERTGEERERRAEHVRDADVIVVGVRSCV